MSKPDPAPVLDLIEAFRRSKTMFTALGLGLFDRLEAGPATAAAVAREMALDASATERLLSACTGLGLVERDETGRYSNRPVASIYLCRASPETMAGYILYSDSVLYKLWEHLDDAVREGSHRWRQAFGLDGPIFSAFFRTPEARSEFLLGMNGLGRVSSPAVVAAFDLTRFHHLVDVGGGTGHLASAACQRYPQLRATLFDLPEVVEEAGRYVDARIELRGGDFFADPLPAGDLYALGRILHDWSEPKIRQFLAKIHAALPPGGGLLIAEKLMDDDFRGPVPAQMQSLNMLVCTEGRERSLPEYRALLESAGFTAVEGRRTGTPLDAVLAVRV